MDLMTLWDMIPLAIRKTLLLIVGIVSAIGLPILGVVVGHSIVEWNTAARSSWRSEQDARAAQWDWPLILGWGGFTIGMAILIFSLLYLFSKEKK